MSDISSELSNQYVLELDGISYLKWEQMNDEPPIEIAGLRELLERPTPFNSSEVIKPED